MVRASPSKRRELWTVLRKDQYRVEGNRIVLKDSER